MLTLLDMTQLTIKSKTKLVQAMIEDLGEGIDLTMILIPPGEFLMGSRKEEPGRQSNEEQYRVIIPEPFLMGKYPVTQAQWQRVATMPQQKRSLKNVKPIFKGANLPIESVSWLDAEEFCLRLSNYSNHRYRLPSEAEWEYACRAGTTSAFHFGETIDTKLANYRGTDNKEMKWSGSYGRGNPGEYQEKTTPVGIFDANDFGLYDMHGNVWEWCADHYNSSYQQTPKDGSAWVNPTAEKNSSRVLRGGSWLDDPYDCRSAYRYGYNAGVRIDYGGFRVVYSPART
jgi:formylglycine-generating enzyme required for sulfatase activity